MMDNLIFIIASSFILSSILNYFTNLFFKKNNLYDNINKRSTHNVYSTRSGGFGVGISIFIISSAYYILGFELYDYSILVPLSLLLVIGLYDDIYSLDFKLKFIFQIIAAKIIVDTGLIIDNFHGILGIYELNRAFAQAFTIFIIVAIVNSINFIDGIDGLALSVTILFIFCYELLVNSFNPYKIFSVILVSSLIPLYYFNFKKDNKVFLGDSGSLFLGGAVSIFTIYILSNDYIIKPEFDLHKILFVISILFYPIIDIIRIFFIRLIKGKSPFIADKNHIHHYIYNKTHSHKLTTIIIVISSVCFFIFMQIIF